MLGNDVVIRCSWKLEFQSEVSLILERDQLVMRKLRL